MKHLANHYFLSKHVNFRQFYVLRKKVEGVMNEPTVTKTVRHSACDSREEQTWISLWIFKDLKILQTVLLLKSLQWPHPMAIYYNIG